MGKQDKWHAAWFTAALLTLPALALIDTAVAY
jgi:hypothetical protein